MNENQLLNFQIVDFCNRCVHKIKRQLGDDICLYIGGSDKSIELNYQNLKDDDITITLTANDEIAFNGYTAIDLLQEKSDVNIFLPNMKLVIYAFAMLQFQIKATVCPKNYLEL